MLEAAASPAVPGKDPAPEAYPAVEENARLGLPNPVDPPVVFSRNGEEVRIGDAVEPTLFEVWCLYGDAERPTAVLRFSGIVRTCTGVFWDDANPACVVLYW